jgi:phosphoglycerate dehydrogenase-like enzyme
MDCSLPNRLLSSGLLFLSARLFGLDTFYEEPGDADNPLIQFSNVIVTPHLGGSPRWNSLDDIEEVIGSLSRHLF